MLAAKTETEDSEVINPDFLWLIPILTCVGSLPWILRWAKCQLAAFGIRRLSQWENVN